MVGRGRKWWGSAGAWDQLQQWGLQFVLLHSDSWTSYSGRGKLTIQIKWIQAVQGLDYSGCWSVCPRTFFRTEEGVIFLAARCVGCPWLIAEPLIVRIPWLMTGQSSGSKARPTGLNVIHLWGALPASEPSTALDGVPWNWVTIQLLPLPKSMSSFPHRCCLPNHSLICFLFFF